MGVDSEVSGKIKVDENYPSEFDEEPPFDVKKIGNIRSNVKFDSLYQMTNLLGDGKFGKVYCVKEKATGREFAAKFIKIRKEADRTEVEREVSILTQLRHPRIAQIYDAFYTTTNDVVLIMEIVRGGELFDRVAEDSYELSELAIVMIICQLCEAIDYIHKQNILHLDVKPENIMCVSSSGNRIKLIDFGLARYYDGSEEIRYMAGTPEFAAPEVIKFEKLDYHTDMWSIGVITYILLSGYSPFLGDGICETYCNVEKGEWEFTEEFDNVSAEAKDFISKLLVYDQSKRMLPHECLQHPWIAKHRRHASHDAILEKPIVAPPLNNKMLVKYNARRKFRRMVIYVKFLIEMNRLRNSLKARKSSKGHQFFDPLLKLAAEKEQKNRLSVGSSNTNPLIQKALNLRKEEADTKSEEKTGETVKKKKESKVAKELKKNEESSNEKRVSTSSEKRVVPSIKVDETQEIKEEQTKKKSIKKLSVCSLQNEKAPVPQKKKLSLSTDRISEKIETKVVRSKSKADSSDSTKENQLTVEDKRPSRQGALRKRDSSNESVLNAVPAPTTLSSPRADIVGLSKTNGETVHSKKVSLPKRHTKETDSVKLPVKVLEDNEKLTTCTTHVLKLVPEAIEKKTALKIKNALKKAEENNLKEENEPTKKIVKKKSKVTKTGDSLNTTESSSRKPEQTESKTPQAKGNQEEDKTVRRILRPKTSQPEVEMKSSSIIISDSHEKKVSRSSEGSTKENSKSKVLTKKKIEEDKSKEKVLINKNSDVLLVEKTRASDLPSDSKSLLNLKYNTTSEQSKTDSITRKNSIRRTLKTEKDTVSTTNKISSSKICEDKVISNNSKSIEESSKKPSLKTRLSTINSNLENGEKKATELSKISANHDAEILSKSNVKSRVVGNNSTINDTEKKINDATIPKKPSVKKGLSTGSSVKDKSESQKLTVNEVNVVSNKAPVTTILNSTTKGLEKIPNNSDEPNKITVNSDASAPRKTSIKTRKVVKKSEPETDKKPQIPTTDNNEENCVKKKVVVKSKVKKSEQGEAGAVANNREATGNCDSKKTTNSITRKSSHKTSIADSAEEGKKILEKLRSSLKTETTTPNISSVEVSPKSSLKKSETKDGPVEKVKKARSLKKIKILDNSSPPDEYKPREDFSFDTLRDTLTRRLSATQESTKTPKEMISIPKTNSVRDRLRKFEGL